jgi:hypothetical protein
MKQDAGPAYFIQDFLAVRVTLSCWQSNDSYWPVIREDAMADSSLELGLNLLSTSKLLLTLSWCYLTSQSMAKTAWRRMTRWLVQKRTGKYMEAVQKHETLQSVQSVSGPCSEPNLFPIRHKNARHLTAALITPILENCVTISCHWLQ